ncbi:UNVERIFIED_CONTAM: hypothetical protein Sangu_2969800 [Sesamum angustifolium]|uniref:DUF4218 domain-containing protein n=1 Tax=Sesamum angustifolium TaxID=2727405 RepID=A0AAW2IJZ6_9LAMI
MEHLIVHLMNDARIGGPVQYRWMYPFERFLRELKKNVKNKAHVEASIVKAYMSKKSACLLHSTLRQTCNPNEACLEEMMSARAAMIDSRASGATKKTWLSGPERHIIETYILTNYEVVTPYYNAKVIAIHAYFVNGYNFQTEHHNTGNSTMNCGISVKVHRIQIRKMISMLSSKRSFN